MVKPYQRIVSLVCIACETCECERCNVEDLAKRIIDDVRADAIDEYKSKLKTDVCVRAQNCYKGMFNEREQEIFNFATKTFLDTLDYFAEQLKEQNNG